MNLAHVITDVHAPPADGEAVALVHHDRRVSYRELRSEVDRLRGGLVALDLGPGARVGIACGITPQFVTSFFAVLGAGLVAVPLNPLSPAPELQRELHAIGAAAAFVGPAAAAAIGGLDRAALPSLAHVVAPEDAGVADAAAFESFGADSPSAPLVERDPGDLAVLLFTSGTAGAPKAAMLTHGNLLANLDLMEDHPLELVRSDDVVLGAIPLFHIQGLNALVVPTLRAGGSVVMMERFDAVAALELIVAERITMVSGSPTMWAAFVALPEADPTAFATVRLAFSGAAPLPLAVARAMLERFGVRLVEGYGLTEAAPGVAVGTTDTPFGSVGRPLPGLGVRLVDTDGRDVLIGDPGEIWVRGPNVFPGYWDDDDATRRVLDDDGWLHTGDIAVVDEYGQLRIVDRAKDLILVSGFNVYPAEVEAVLTSHPAVEAAAVVGASDAYHGEAVRAFVVPADAQAVGADELIAYCEARLAHYKCPVSVSLVDELPRTASGKVVRRGLS